MSDIENDEGRRDGDGSNETEKIANTGVTQVIPAGKVPSHLSGAAEDILDPAEQEAYAQLQHMRKQKRRRRLVGVGIACAVVLAGIGGAIAWQNYMSGSQGEERRVVTDFAYQGTFVNEVSASGSIQPASSTIITPQIDGTIQSVNVVSGQQVQEGDVLFTIQNNDLDRAVSAADRDRSSAARALEQANTAVSDVYAARTRAESENSQAWAEYNQAYDAYQAAYRSSADPSSDERVIELQATMESALAAAQTTDSALQDVYDSFSASLASAQDGVESAQAGVESAQEAYETALENAAAREVKSPITGTVIELNATPGQSIGATAQASGSTTLCQVANLTEMKVTVQVGEADINEVEVGQTARLTFSAVDDEIEGEVVSVAATSGSGDSYGYDGGGSSATYSVEIVVREPDSRIRPGMTAQVSIVTTQIDDTLIVPTLALTDLGDDTALVSVQVDPETHEMREVTVRVISRSNSEAAVEVIDGELSDGDEVVVSDTGGTEDEYYVDGVAYIATEDYSGEEVADVDLYVEE